jgi:hypothetical protein
MDVINTPFIDLSEIDTLEQFEDLDNGDKVLTIYCKLKYIGKEQKRAILEIVDDIHCEETLCEIFRTILITIENSGLL